MEPVNPVTSNLHPGSKQKDTAIDGAESNVSSSVQLPVMGSTNFCIPSIEGADWRAGPMQGIEHAAARKVKETETVQYKKEQADNAQDDVRLDGDSKQRRDAKGV